MATKDHVPGMKHKGYNQPASEKSALAQVSSIPQTHGGEDDTATGAMKSLPYLSLYFHKFE